MASFGTRGGGDQLEPAWRSGKGGATLQALAHDIRRGKSLHQPRSRPSKRDLFLRIKFVDAPRFRCQNQSAMTQKGCRPSRTVS
jgi:hypothetical protein